MSFSATEPIGHNEFVVIKSSSRLPNPVLFPYLSRRLAASGVEGLRSRDVAADSDTTTTDDADSLDDVDAAAAMLSLKHGPHVLTPKKGICLMSLHQNPTCPETEGVRIYKLNPFA
jgi:hypothetical protein